MPSGRYFFVLFLRKTGAFFTPLWLIFLLMFIIKFFIFFFLVLIQIFFYIIIDFISSTSTVSFASSFLLFCTEVSFWEVVGFLISFAVLSLSSDLSVSNSFNSVVCVSVLFSVSKTVVSIPLLLSLLSLKFDVSILLIAGDLLSFYTVLSI